MLNPAVKRKEIIEDQTERYWRGVMAKDTSLDGSFVFAVRTTGVYCRPSCPSRRPRRENVKFFASPDSAEAGGFRACLRCRPKEERPGTPQADLVLRACALLDREEEETPDLAQLAARLNISPFHLQRTFKRVTGISPRQFVAARRMKKFKDGVKSGESIVDAMYGAGFGSSSRLYEQATAELGMTPATYSREGRGANISFTTTPCSLGRLLVAATKNGICAVRVGDSDSVLESDLRNEFSAAVIARDTKSLKNSVATIVDHLAGRQPRLDLPLDIQATAFQRQVWEALRAIPYGATRSYTEVAESIGRPTAVRAVARACASNPVALVIPCHRVIREDKSLGGYRWGIDRKKKLLAQEEKLAKQ